MNRRKRWTDRQENMRRRWKKKVCGWKEEVYTQTERTRDLENRTTNRQMNK